MLVSMLRTFIIYTTIVISMRLMGKRQHGELEPLELVIAIMISDVASIPIQNHSIPLLKGIVPVLTLLVIEVIISFFIIKSRKLRKMIFGTPAVIIRNGFFIIPELKRCRLDINDILEELRTDGYPDITKVAAAIIETNGKISVLPVPSASPLTASDMGIVKKTSMPPQILIVDGHIETEALRRAGKDIVWLRRKLSEAGFSDKKQVFFAALFDGSHFFVQAKDNFIKGANQ